MEQVQIDTIKQMRDTALRLVIEINPGSNIAELDAMEKLFAVHKHLRQIDYSKLGQLALLPQEKPEPGAVQLPLPSDAAVQSGEDSLTGPLNKDEAKAALTEIGGIIKAHTGGELEPEFGANDLPPTEQTTSDHANPSTDLDGAHVYSPDSAFGAKRGYCVCHRRKNHPIHTLPPSDGHGAEDFTEEKQEA